MLISRNVSFCLLSLKILLFVEVALSRGNQIDVTYEDLEILNATCEDLDNCKKERSRDDIPTYNCICGEFCSQSNTCCVDSKHRMKDYASMNKYNCVTIYGHWPISAYMIDTCNTSWSGDTFVEELCLGNGEDLDDPFLLAPVTNPVTRTTYKNYFCSVCNNDANVEQLVFWNLYLSGTSAEVNSSSVPEIHYDSKMRRWTMGYASENSSIVSVNVKFYAPPQLHGRVFECLSRVISECDPDWVDETIKEKCHSYMALVGFMNETYKRYRNPHCAICNFEKLENKTCTQLRPIAYSPYASNTFFVRLFSLYDKTSKCDDNMVYDTIAKKCRRTFKG